MISTSALLILMSVCAPWAISAELPFSAGEDFDWEDFQAAITNEDCFGSHCGSASGALSMLQQKVVKIKPGRQVNDGAAETNQEELEESVTAHAIPMDELTAAMMSEEIAVEAASLIQTDAHYERSNVASHDATVTAAVQADGSFEMNPQKMALPSEGMAYFSVDEHGDFHREEALSLVQTEAHVERKATPPSHPTVAAAVNADGTFEMNPHMTTVPSDGMMQISADAHGDFHGEQALSLMQTEAHVERKATLASHSTVAAAVNAVGTFEMNPHKATVHSDGMMHISVDAHGDFRGEEALSLVQTEARIERKSTAGPPEIADEVFADDDVYDFGMSGEEGAVSLLQTDFHIERVGASQEVAGAVNADGTFEMNPSKTALPEDGVMHVSVDAHGAAHLEI